MFVGDDRTDLDGFRVIDALRSGERVLETAAEAPIRFVKVAVGSDEAPAELLEEADVVLEDQSRVEATLAALVGA